MHPHGFLYVFAGESMQAAAVALGATALSIRSAIVAIIRIRVHLPPLIRLSLARVASRRIAGV
jgi:hypothetical protein